MRKLRDSEFKVISARSGSRVKRNRTCALHFQLQDSWGPPGRCPEHPWAGQSFSDEFIRQLTSKGLRIQRLMWRCWKTSNWYSSRLWVRRGFTILGHPKKVAAEQQETSPTKDLCYRISKHISSQWSVSSVLLTRSPAWGQAGELWVIIIFRLSDCQLLCPIFATPRHWCWW